MGKLTSILRRTFSFMSFGRKKPDTDETAATDSAPDDASQATPDPDTTLVTAQTPPDPEAQTAEDDALEVKPSLWHRITTPIRQLFIRRNNANMDGEPNPGDALSSAQNKAFAAEQAAQDELSETPPKKRRIPLKKLLFIALPVLMIILIASVASVMLIRSNTRQQEAITLENKHKKTLEAEFKKLQEKNSALLEENKKLRSIPAPPPAAAMQEATSGTISKVAPETLPPDSNGSKPSPTTGDCAVTNKGSAGESLKRCIDAYNAASGR